MPARREALLDTHPPVPSHAAMDVRQFGSVLERWEGAATEAWRASWRVPAVVAFARTTSTNDVARALAAAGAPAGTVILAEEQTAGRGRAGRRWAAEPGSSLLLSVVLRPGTGSASDAPASVLPLRLGLAIARTVERAVGRPAEIKWPNDVLVDGRKLAGILCESAVGGPGGTFVIAGIGLNVQQRKRDFPPEIAAAATSLAMVSAAAAERGRIASALFDELRPVLGGFGDGLDSDTLAGIGQRDALFGLPVDVDGTPAGIACGIARDGALMIRTASGGRVRIYNGTVRIRHDGFPR